MTTSDYTTSFTVAQTPAEVFAAINNPRAWWPGEFDGETDRLGAEFTYSFKTMHRSVQRITALVPGQKVVWSVIDAEMTFIADTTEWVGTEIIFDITTTGQGTELRFTHVGLLPTVECFNDCSNAWGSFINGSLRNLITGAAVAA